MSKYLLILLQNCNNFHFCFNGGVKINGEMGIIILPGIYS